MNLQDQLTEIEAQIAEEVAKGGDKDQNTLAALEQKQAVILMQMDEEQTKQQQEAAQQVRIEQATAQAAYFLDNLVIEGLTMRELCVDEPQYQMLRIAVQNKLINLAEDHIKNIGEVQADENAQRVVIQAQLDAAQKKIEDNDREAFEDHETIRQLRADLHQAQLEVTDTQSKLKNAGDEIERLNSQVDDLRKEIAVGARNAYKVTDVEQTQQLKQLADQIKAARIHVYDVEPDNVINPKNYTASRADNGEQVTYNWTQAKNYIEIKDPNEVEQFRQQFANQNVVPDISLAEPIQDSLTEVPLPTIPSVTAPEVDVPAEVQLVVSAPTDGGQGGQTVEERLNALEAHVFGYVKQAVA